MTIIVGILCNDGCIIASDGMASNNLGHTPFVGIKNTKIHTIGDEVIISCAGDDNLMTLFRNFLEQNFSRLKIEKKDTCASDLAAAIGAQFSHKILEIYQQYPALVQDHHVNLIKQSGFNFGAVMAFEFGGTHHMCVYNQLLFPSMVRSNGIWYSIIGSGDLVAKPSIHLVKKILNINEQPDVNKGSILAYWTISHAIEVSSGGIGGDISLHSLSKNNDSYKISKGEASECQLAINDIYEHIKKYGKADESEIQTIPQLQ